MEPADAKRIFLKLDTQGWDTEAIQGAASCLHRVQAIQTETSVYPLYEDMPTWHDSMSQLNEIGFVPSGMFPVAFHGGFRAVEFDLVSVRQTPAD